MTLPRIHRMMRLFLSVALPACGLMLATACQDPSAFLLSASSLTVDSPEVAAGRTSDENGAIAAGPASSAAPAPTASAEEIQAGIDVYVENYCGLCHSLAAAETKGIFGPSHDEMGIVATARIADPAYTGSATTPVAYLYESLVDPLAFVADEYKLTRHPMPAYTHLTEEDLQALVAMLAAQR